MQHRNRAGKCAIEDVDHLEPDRTGRVPAVPARLDAERGKRSALVASKIDDRLVQLRFLEDWTNRSY